MGTNAVSFAALYQRVLSRIAERVSNGEFSERRLAAELGVSQPHMNRLLKGSRGLTPEVADRMLARLGLTVTDLLTQSDAEVHLAAVPRKDARHERQRTSWQKKTA